MNQLLARFYGSTAAEKLSSVTKRDEELALVRMLDEAIRGDLIKRSNLSSVPGDGRVGAVIHALGGPEQALRKLSWHQRTLEAWERGEKDGRELARAGMEMLFEQAHDAARTGA